MKNEIAFHRLMSVASLAGIFIVGGMAYNAQQPQKLQANTQQVVQSAANDDFMPTCEAHEAEDGLLLALSSGESVVYHEGKSWVGYNGEPINLTIINDATCGEACDTTQSVEVLKQALSPAMLVNTVDIASAEGQKLVADLNLTQIPAFVTGKEIMAQAAATQTAGLVTPNGDNYVINGSALGLPSGKYISTPKIADKALEPHKGDVEKGLQVIEFTAFQCGYCGRFYNGAKDTIERLVSEGKIHFALKDFPIGQPNSHVGANCAQAQSEEAYWTVHDKLLENQSAWSRTEDAGSGYIRNIAEEIGLDMAAFDACITDGAALAEVSADQAEGRTFGVRGTPALLIGTQLIPGAIDAARFEAIVNEELLKL